MSKFENVNRSHLDFFLFRLVRWWGLVLFFNKDSVSLCSLARAKTIDSSIASILMALTLSLVAESLLLLLLSLSVSESGA